MSKKLFALFAVLLIASLLLAACGGSRDEPTPEPQPEATEAPAAQATEAPSAETQPEPTEAPAAQEPVSITFWEQEEDTIDPFIDELIAEFMEEHPNVTVERVSYGNEELRDQFQVASLAGEAPQLVRVPNDFAGPFSALDIIYDLNDVFEPAYLDQFFEGALGPAVVSGAQYGVPDNYGNHLMLLYNKELVDEVPTDTDAWIAQLQELTTGDQFGLAYNLNEPFWLAGWIGGFGGWPLDETDSPDLASQGMIDALQFVQDLKFTHEVTPVDADYDTAQALFREGKAAYFINGDWSLGSYLEGDTALPFEWGTAAMPMVSRTGEWPSPMTAGKYWMISNEVEGDELEASKTFIEHMTSDPVQERWLNEFKRLPSSKSVAESADAITSDPILAGSMEQLSHGRGMPAAPQMRCAWDAMRPNLEAVMANSMTPEDAAAAMQAEANKCVEDAGFEPGEPAPEVEEKAGAEMMLGDADLTASITFWEQEEDTIDPFIDELLDGFNELYPNVTVERVSYGNEELRDQFQVASLAGEAPQLVRVPNDFAGPFSALDIIYDLNDVFESAFFDQFFDGALGPAVVGGAQYGAPDNFGNHLMLLYNKELVDEVPADTDAWVEQLKELTTDDQFGLAYNLNEPFWLAGWIGGFGGWPLDETDSPDLASQGMIDALQFVQDLKFTHEVTPVDADYDTAQALFREGKAAYFINGDWSLGGYLEGDTALPFEWGTTAMPMVSSTGEYPSPMTSGKYWMISNEIEGDELEASKALIMYMSSNAVQERWLNEFIRLPSSKTLAESADAITSDPILAGSMEQLSHGRGSPAAPQMRCAWDAMRPNLEAVMANSATPADAAAAMQAEAEKCVEDAGF